MKLGIFVKCPHPEMIEAIGIAGLDFAVVDMEHTPIGPRDLYPLVLAAERRALTLVVRIPSNDLTYIKWCRDLGVNSIQVPHIETVADAQFAITDSYFNPVGERGLCRFVRAADFSSKPKERYTHEANTNTRLILQIEGQRALTNVPGILKAIPQETSLFIGPYDLSQSLGKPGQIWDSEVVSTMQDIIHQCKTACFQVGTFADSLEGIRFWEQHGINFIEYGSDLNLFLDATKSLQQEVNRESKHT